MIAEPRAGAYTGRYGNVRNEGALKEAFDLGDVIQSQMPRDNRREKASIRMRMPLVVWRREGVARLEAGHQKVCLDGPWVLAHNGEP